MEHAKALGIKALMTLVILYLVLGLGYQGDFGDVFILTLLLGIISYIAGDLFILPKAGNLIATVSDFVLSFLIIWGFGLMLNISNDNLVSGALFSALLVALGEWMFHSYMAKNILHDSSKEI
ncbi:YndM family protein [Mesobacillus foraminis]|uniref:YndM family protein n=1 Tax=Mesobacillus foraminis TaxID=279826 RepID=UPI000EF51D70|nr:YndM family protein [Mesobacillus foraminis]